jgi:hypothetical protein
MTAHPEQQRAALRTGVAITSLIGVATAVVSYYHALDVVRAAGATGMPVWLTPLFADGLILLCSTAIYAGAQRRVARPIWGTVGLVFGIGVTVTMNVAAGIPSGPALALIDALAPVVFLVSLEVLAWLLRLGRAGQPGDSPAQCPHGVPGSVDEAIRLDWEHRRDCLSEKVSYLQHGARWGVDRRRVPELVGAALNGDGSHE